MESLPKEPAFCQLLQESFLFRGLPKSLAEEALLSEGCEAVAFSPGEALYSPTCFRQAVALLAEGEAAKRSDIKFLSPLPLFNADGSVKE